MGRIDFLTRVSLPEERPCFRNGGRRGADVLLLGAPEAPGPVCDGLAPQSGALLGAGGGSAASSRKSGATDRPSARSKTCPQRRGASRLGPSPKRDLSWASGRVGSWRAKCPGVKSHLTKFSLFPAPETLCRSGALHLRCVASASARAKGGR